MRKSLFVATVAGAATLGFWASPSIAQDDTDQKFGTVHFATSCNETAQRRFDPPCGTSTRSGTRLPGKYSRSAQGQSLGIADWGMALGLLDNRPQPAACGQSAAWPCRYQGSESHGARRQRERDFNDALAVMYVDYDTIPHPTRVSPTSRRWKRWLQNILTTMRHRSSTRLP